MSWNFPAKQNISAKDYTIPNQEIPKPSAAASQPPFNVAAEAFYKKPTAV
jgi:hypothetical protein